MGRQKAYDTEEERKLARKLSVWKVQTENPEKYGLKTVKSRDVLEILRTVDTVAQAEEAVLELMAQLAKPTIGEIR